MRRGGSIVLLGLAVIAFCPGSASAASVSSGGVIADPGEVNVVTAEPGSIEQIGERVDRRLRHVRWTDSGSSVEASFGCVSMARDSAECVEAVGAPTLSMACFLGFPFDMGIEYCDTLGFARLGDRSDVLVINGFTDSWYVDGGTGDDLITAAGFITAGLGDDTISGLSGTVGGELRGSYVNADRGRDIVRGSSRDDVIDSQDMKIRWVEPYQFPATVRKPERDRVDCGDGIDRVRADRLDVIAGNCEQVKYRDNAALWCPAWPDRFEPGFDFNARPRGSFDARTLFRLKIDKARRRAKRHGCSVRVAARDGKPRAELDREKHRRISVDLETRTRRVRYVLGIG